MSNIKKDSKQICFAAPFDLAEWLEKKGAAETRKIGPQVVHILKEVKAAEEAAESARE